MLVCGYFRPERDEKVGDYSGLSRSSRVVLVVGIG